MTLWPQRRLHKTQTCRHKKVLKDKQSLLGGKICSYILGKEKSLSKDSEAWESMVYLGESYKGFHFVEPKTSTVLRKVRWLILEKQDVGGGI